MNALTSLTRSFSSRDSHGDKRRASVARIGFTYRRAPGVAALRDLVISGELGRVLHVDAR
jgi:predicted dehydrogenase